MRAVAGEAALEVAVDALGQLGGQLLRRRGPRARAVRAARALALQPERRRRARRTRVGEPLDRRRAVAPSARRRGGRARRPTPAARRATARPARIAAEQRVALGQRRACTRAACPARAGHSAATTWSRCARRSAGAPLTSSSRSGRKTDDQRPRGRRRAAARPGAPSTRRRLASPGWKPTRQRVRAVARPAPSQLQPRQLRAEAHELALVARSGTSGRCSRSTAPPAGWSCRRRCGP